MTEEIRIREAEPGTIHLYETRSYRKIRRYGRPVGDPLSMCFEKALEMLI